MRLEEQRVSPSQAAATSSSSSSSHLSSSSSSLRSSRSGSNPTTARPIRPSDDHHITSGKKSHQSASSRSCSSATDSLSSSSFSSSSSSTTSSSSSSLPLPQGSELVKPPASIPLSNVPSQSKSTVARRTISESSFQRPREDFRPTLYASLSGSLVSHMSVSCNPVESDRKIKILDSNREDMPVEQTRSMKCELGLTSDDDDDAAEEAEEDGSENEKDVVADRVLRLEDPKPSPLQDVEESTQSRTMGATERIEAALGTLQQGAKASRKWIEASEELESLRRSIFLLTERWARLEHVRKNLSNATPSSAASFLTQEVECLSSSTQKMKDGPNDGFRGENSQQATTPGQMSCKDLDSNLQRYLERYTEEQGYHMHQVRMHARALRHEFAHLQDYIDLWCEHVSAPADPVSLSVSERTTGTPQGDPAAIELQRPYPMYTDEAVQELLSSAAHPDNQKRSKEGEEGSKNSVTGGKDSHSHTEIFTLDLFRKLHHKVTRMEKRWKLASDASTKEMNTATPQGKCARLQVVPPSTDGELSKKQELQQHHDSLHRALKKLHGKIDLENQRHEQLKAILREAEPHPNTQEARSREMEEKERAYQSRILRHQQLTQQRSELQESLKLRNAALDKHTAELEERIQTLKAACESYTRTLEASD